MADRIRLMTHNVWNRDVNAPAWEERGEDCSAPARVDGLLRVYRETLPDVIGGQEVSALMADLLMEGFREERVRYTLIWGRFTPILYRADRLELIDSAFFTYPERMDGLEGSFNDVKSKAWSLGVFRVKKTGKTFLFATTHLWWKKEPVGEACAGKSGYQAGSDEARERQIAMLVETLKEYHEKYACPVIMVGDMNTSYNSKAMEYVRKNGFRHAHDVATEYAEEAVGYHYCFPAGYETRYYDRPFETAIDHIYVMGEREGSVKRFERYSPDYYFPISDHSPAYIDMEL
ncbi:MAG: hypothetical protein E7620_09045 [Ruminococcaceae bacterium]|nr:hypothetical protein [Oscillospiraceae bacterium]